jgi:hypothetical protein
MMSSLLTSMVTGDATTTHSSTRLHTPPYSPHVDLTSPSPHPPLTVVRFPDGHEFRTLVW